MPKLLHLSIIATLFAGTAGLLIDCDHKQTTTPDPSPLAIIYPAGGETFFVGDTLYIKWQAQAELISSVKVLITVGNSGEKLVSGKSLSAASGTCRWVVGQEYELPKNSFPNSNVTIVIRDYDDQYVAISKQFSVQNR